MPQGINTGEILEALNDKMDRDGHNVQSPTAFIVETYSNGTEWYRVWSDGWCEQGGIYDKGSTSSQFSTTISLFKPFANTNYFVSAIVGGMAGDKYGQIGLNMENRINTSFDLYFFAGSSDGVRYIYWKAEGYIA